MATFTCAVCLKESTFLSLQHSMRVAGVCRSTIYYWMEKGWIHWRELPSGRRLICGNSLSRPSVQVGATSFSPVSQPELHKSA